MIRFGVDRADKTCNAEKLRGSYYASMQPVVRCLGGPLAKTWCVVGER